MRNTIIVCLAGLALAACSKAEQAEATQDARQAGDKVAASVKDAAHDVASDEDLQKAKAEVDKAAQEAGAAVKAAGENAKAAAADAAKDVARDTKAAVHEATAPTPEDKAAEKK
jgi:hypothetical protein